MEKKNKLTIRKVNAILALLALCILLILDILSWIRGDISFSLFIFKFLRVYVLSAIVFLALPYLIVRKYKKKIKNRVGSIFTLVHVILAYVVYTIILNIISKEPHIFVGLIWPIIYYCIIVYVFVESKDSVKPKMPER